MTTTQPAPGSADSGCTCTTLHTPCIDHNTREISATPGTKLLSTNSAVGPFWQHAMLLNSSAVLATAASQLLATQSRPGGRHWNCYMLPAVMRTTANNLHDPLHSMRCSVGNNPKAVQTPFKSHAMQFGTATRYVTACSGHSMSWHSPVCAFTQQTLLCGATNNGKHKHCNNVGMALTLSKLSITQHPQQSQATFRCRIVTDGRQTHM